jgi:hypothetical protein
VHVVNEAQRNCFPKILAAMKDTDQQAMAVPSVIMAQWGGSVNELRALKDEDVPRAQELAGLFAGLGLPVKVVNLTNVWKGAAKVRPNTFELWFGDGMLPVLCAT